MSDWPGWAGVIVAVLSFAASAYAIYDARKAREAVDRAEKLSIIDTLLNQHEIRRSHWDIWGYAEVDLKGMRTAISEWRDICSQQMNLLPRDSAKWFTVRDLAQEANSFSRATDDIAQRWKQSDGSINIGSPEDNEKVKHAVEQFQQRTRELIGKLTSLRNSPDT